MWRLALRFASAGLGSSHQSVARPDGSDRATDGLRLDQACPGRLPQRRRDTASIRRRTSCHDTGTSEEAQVQIAIVDGSIEGRIESFAPL
jgi:hypothetical protein